MMFGWGGNLLMDWNGGVNNFWLNCLFVNHRLYDLMYVVVHMFTSNAGCSSSRLSCLFHSASVLKLSKSRGMFLFVLF